MSCIHYKFRSALEYDTITFDGLSISLADLKHSIITQKKFGKSTDFDLEVTNAQTKESKWLIVKYYKIHSTVVLPTVVDPVYDPLRVCNSLLKGLLQSHVFQASFNNLYCSE